MRKLIFMLCMLMTVTVQAQQLPVENIFFKADKEDYRQSDSIYIQGRVVSNDTLGIPYSHYLDMELWNSDDSLIVHHKLRCNENGRFADYLQVPFDVPSGVYYLRAYTRLMLNYPLTTLPIETVYVGRVKKSDDAEIADFTEYRCAFYPEGGHALQGVPQSMAVRLLSKDGKPARVPYYICDQKGDTLLCDTTTHSGWQRFIITQQPDNRYYFCTYNSENKLQRYELPAPDGAPVITSLVNRMQLVYRIHATDQERQKLSLYIYHPHIGLQLMPTTVETGVIRLDDLPEGMLSLLLLNENKETVSQTFQYITKKVK